MKPIAHGMSLRKAIKEAAKLGCKVHNRRRTGEVRVVAPDGRRVRCNARRKDAPRKLTLLLRRL